MKALPLLIASLASVAIAEDFKTLDGREYKDASVLRVEPDGIVLATNAGVAKVYFLELPNDLRERFHFDAAKAAAFATEQNAQYEATRKQREEARQKQAEEMERIAENQSRDRAELDQQRELLEEQEREIRPQSSRFSQSRSGETVPERTYELLQDHTITIRSGANGASIHLKRGERYRGRILADHAEIDIRGISYWLPASILTPVRD